ncbi:MAG: VWA domain-containing protein [Synergistaceae bacterium]|nr:VWA domain-containing protein [Synergistaceae bacterium]
MRITHNIPAIRAFNALNSTSRAMENSIRKLSSGLRINSAADDASGYAISEKMRSQIRGLDMAAQNTKDGISFLQTAEGSLESINSMLQRMRELAVQSANDTLTAKDRSFIQLEVDQLRDQIDKIAHNTQFNRKRLLDGSSEASWSCADLNVKVNINGGLTWTDQFGQKVNNAGNYRIQVTTEPGVAQVQKTNIMSAINNETETTAQVLFVLDTSSSMSSILGDVKSNISSFVDNIKSNGTNNVEIGICTYGTNDLTDPNVQSYTFTDGTLWSDDIDEVNTTLNGITAPYAIDTNNYYAVKTAADIYRSSFSDNLVTGDNVRQKRYIVLITDTDHSGSNTGTAGTATTEAEVKAALEGDDSTLSDDIQLTVIGPSTDETSEFYTLCNDSGGSLLTSSGDDWASGLVNDLSEKIAKDSTAYVDPAVCPADPDTKLSELTSFVSNSGVNLLENPQQITLTQGTKITSFYIDKGDTLTSLAKKINDAIADGLGQKQYTQDLNHFANYVYEATENTSEAVPGTMIIRSVVAGKEGEIHFAGDETILGALGLNTIQESQESKFTANVFDAHSGKCIATGVSAATADFRGLISPAVDVKIDPMSAINSLWSESSKSFIQTKGTAYETIIHLTDNTTILQTGANSGEDFIIQLDDSGSHAIGIDTVNVATRENAAAAITLIDRAIEKVAGNRAKIGAYQNALEWTQENLETSSLNLSQAESRIRDADMAKEMMEFVRLQILTESGTAMLSQANGMPRSVLSLLS